MQKENSKSTKFTDILNKLLIALFVAFIFGTAVFQAVLPDKSFSEQENRTLKQLPKLSSGEGTVSENIKNGKFLDRLLSGEYASDMNKYLSDQFPMRDTLVGIKAAIEVGLFKQQNNDVLLGKNGYLFNREDYPSYENLEKILEALEKTKVRLRANVNFELALELLFLTIRER